MYNAKSETALTLELIDEYQINSTRREDIRLLLHACFPGSADDPYDAFALKRTY